MGTQLGGLIGGFFNKDPYKKEEAEIGNIPGLLSSSYSPYMSEGKQDLGTLHNQFMSMLQNPDQVLNRLGSGYTQSPGYNFQLNQGLDAANRANAAGGSLGSVGNQVQLQKLGQNEANQDYGQYMNRAMGMYQGGLGGLGHLEDQGYNATNQYTSGMGNYYDTMAQLAGARAQRQNQRETSMGAGIGGLIGSAGDYGNQMGQQGLQDIEGLMGSSGGSGGGSGGGLGGLSSMAGLLAML